MSAPELKQRVAEIEQQVRDVTDYLCSRGDTMPLRVQIEGQVRRAIHGLSQKGWRVVRAYLCAPQDARVQAMVEAAIAEDTATNRRATSRERKQYLRGRIEALKDLRAALRDMKGSE